MDVSATLDDSGTAGVLIAELVARLHRGLLHCDDDGA